MDIMKNLTVCLSKKFYLLKKSLQFQSNPVVKIVIQAPHPFLLFSFLSFFLFNLENLGSWWELLSLAGVYSYPVLLLVPFMGWSFHAYFHFNFHVVVEKSIGLERSVSLLLNFFFLLLLIFPRHAPWYEYAYWLLSYRQWCPPPEASLTTWKNNSPLLPQVTECLCQQL